MSKLRHVLILSAAVAALGALGACSPVTARQGFQVQDVAPRDVKVGDDTKSTVLSKLGSPSAVSTFEPNIWYYVSQTAETYTYHKPLVSQRDVTVITFDKGSEKVIKVASLGLKDGRRLDYAKRETPTRGREMTVLEQLLGNVGRQGLPPNDDENVPGGRRRE
jgi:outer membrane protein assembly factor BamE (lipoprotein component of BamABCDE complex)